MLRGLALAACALAVPPGLGLAQQAGGFSLGSPVEPQSALVTLDEERLFAETLYGQRVARELDRASEMLARENRGLELQLSTEEQSLTERRAGLSPEAFRALADAFDAKVTRVRREQDSKARALTRRLDLERAAFINRAVPILSQILAERGAVAIIDERAVFLASERIDITAEAIRRIDADLGDGGDLPPVVVPDAPEPDPADPDGLMEEGVE